MKDLNRTDRAALALLASQPIEELARALLEAWDTIDVLRVISPRARRLLPENWKALL